MFRNILILILSGAALGGCGYAKLADYKSLQTPQFSYLSHEVREVTDRYATVDFYINAHNPNAIGLRNVLVSYELITGEKQFLKGRDITLELAPQGDTVITVPTRLVYADLLHALGPLLERILLKDEYVVPVTVNGMVYGKPTVYDEYGEGRLFSFEWPFSRTEEIELPEQEIKRAVLLLFMQ